VAHIEAFEKSEEGLAEHRPLRQKTFPAMLPRLDRLKKPWLRPRVLETGLEILNAREYTTCTLTHGCVT